MRRLSKTTISLDRLKQSFGRSFVWILVLCLSIVSCTPSNNPGTSIVNNYGGDKNDPGGYGGGSTGDGGGGQGIQCTADAKNPTFRNKLFVRDIFEAIYNSKLEIKEGPSATSTTGQLSDAELAFLLDTLHAYFGPFIKTLEIGKSTYWSELFSKINFVGDEVKLNYSRDANSPILLPAGCKIVQIAFWDDSQGQSESGTLYVDKILWSQLDTVNRSALLIHEYFFKEARQAGYKNSDFVRSRIGRLFSRNEMEPLFGDLPKDSKDIDSTRVELSDFKFCVGRSQMDPTAEMHIYQKFGNVTIPFLRSKKITISSLQGLSFDGQYRTSDPTKVFDLAYLSSFFANPNIIADQFNSTDRNRPENLYKMNFILRGSQREKTYDQPLQELFNSLVADVNQMGNPAWTVRTSTPTTDLEFQLENPVEDLTKSLPKGDIFPALFRALELEFRLGAKELNKSTNERINNKILPEDEAYQEIVKLYSIMNLEVTEAVNNGALPKSFTKSNNAASELAKKILFSPTKENFEKLASVVGPLLKLLYHAKLGILSSAEEEFISQTINESLLEEDDRSPMKIALGKMTVKSKTDAVEFDLTCMDGGGFNSLTMLGDKQIGAKKETPVQYEMDLKKYEGYYSVKATDVERILKNLSGRPRLEGRFEGSCSLLGQDFGNRNLCNEKKQLVLKMMSTEKVKVLPCSTFDSSIEYGQNYYTDERKPKCVILNPMEGNAYYLVAEFPVNTTKGPDHSYLVRAIVPPDLRYFEQQ